MTLVVASILPVIWHGFELFRTFFQMVSPYTDPLIIILLVSVATMHFTNIWFALKHHLRNVEFRKFRIQALPVFLPATKRFGDGAAYTRLDMGINIPAYNEESVIINTVLRALHTPYDYGEKEILVVVDGALDRTIPLLMKEFDLVLDYSHPEPIYQSLHTADVKAILRSNMYSNLRMLVKDNSGKHDTLNVGLKYFSRNVTVVLNMDADTLLEDQALNHMARKFIQNPYASAIAGVIIPTYKPVIQKAMEFKTKFQLWYRKALVGIQKLEYLPAFHVSRGGHSANNSMMIISGAFGLFNRAYLLEIGGYKKGLGEDMDVTLRLQEHFWSTGVGEVLFEPRAACYTAAPFTLHDLYTQRVRWFKGLIENLLNFKQLLRFNFFGLAYLEYLIVEVLMPLIIPLGVLLVIINPAMISNKLFTLSLFGIFGLNALKTVIGMLIESHYRPVNWALLLLLPIQLLLSPLFSFWKQRSLLSFKDKSWGSINKQFQ